MSFSITYNPSTIFYPFQEECDWSEELAAGKAESKCIAEVVGEQFVMIPGAQKMQMLFVEC